MKTKISLIIPCLNEEANILPTLARIAAIQPADNPWEVILVDDGSTDRTAELATRACRTYPWLKLVLHPRNMGLGAAMRTGFQHATGAIICSMDSDCTFAPERLPQLINLIHQGADIATGSPWHPGSTQGDVHPVRKALSQSCSRLYRALLRSELHCYTSIFRAYRREVVENIPVTSNGFVAVAEFLVAALRAGYKVSEMPVRLDRRIHGESKINVFASIKSHLRLMSRLAWMAWHPQGGSAVTGAH